MDMGVEGWGVIVIRHKFLWLVDGGMGWLGGRVGGGGVAFWGYLGASGGGGGLLGLYEFGVLGGWRGGASSFRLGGDTEWGSGRSGEMKILFEGCVRGCR